MYSASVAFLRVRRINIEIKKKKKKTKQDQTISTTAEVRFLNRWTLQFKILKNLYHFVRVILFVFSQQSTQPRVKILKFNIENFLITENIIHRIIFGENIELVHAVYFPLPTCPFGVMEQQLELGSPSIPIFCN